MLRDASLRDAPQHEAVLSSCPGEQSLKAIARVVPGIHQNQTTDENPPLLFQNARNDLHRLRRAVQQNANANATKCNGKFA